MALPAHVIEKELTFEDYMSEGEINRRYDIIDGKREYMPAPSDRHQDIIYNVAEQFKAYQRRVGFGKAMIAPSDVLITKKPLRTRQPDTLFISTERYAGRDPLVSSAISPAPELVVEVLSPSERRAMRLAKIKDYCKVGVQECWIISPQSETVEVLRLTQIAHETVEIYGADQLATSITFPDLTVKLEDIFRVDE